MISCGVESYSDGRVLLIWFLIIVPTSNNRPYRDDLRVISCCDWMNLLTSKRLAQAGKLKRDRRRKNREAVAWWTIMDVNLQTSPYQVSHHHYNLATELLSCSVHVYREEHQDLCVHQHQNVYFQGIPVGEDTPPSRNSATIPRSGNIFTASLCTVPSMYRSWS